MEPISALSALKVVATTISLAKNLGSFGRWLTKNKGSPISLAVDRTVQKFESVLPDIRNQLLSFLEAPDTAASLDQASAEGASVDRLADELVRLGSIYFPDAAQAEDIARKVVTFLLGEIDDELLRTSEAAVHLDRKQEARQGELIDAIDSAQTKVVAAIASVRLPERIEKLRLLCNGKAPAESRVLWEALASEVDADGDVPAVPRAQIYTEIASCDLALGELERAEARLKRAYQLDPTSPKSQVNRALALALGGSREQAFEIVDKIISEHPANAKALAVKAQIYALGNDYDRVRQLLDPVFDSGVADSTCMRLLAHACIETHATARAMNVAKEAVRLEPDSDICLFLYGQALAAEAQQMILARKGEEATALATNAREKFQSSLKIAERKGLKTNQAQALSALARLDFFFGRYHPALDAAQRARLLDPTSTLGTKLAAKGMLLVSTPAEALRLIEPLLQTPTEWEEESFEVYLTAVSQSGELEAVSRVRGTIERAWGNTAESPVYARKGFIDLAIDKRAFDLARVEMATFPDPASADFAFLEARLALAQGQLDQARAAANRALERLGSNSRPQTIGPIANLFLQLRDGAKAAELFRRVGASPGGSPALFRNYLKALLMQLDEANAQDEILRLGQESERIGVEESLLRIAKAFVFAHRGELQKEETEWREVLRQDSLPAQRIRLARCFVQAGSWEGFTR